MRLPREDVSPQTPHVHSRGAPTPHSPGGCVPSTPGPSWGPLGTVATSGQKGHTARVETKSPCEPGDACGRVPVTVGGRGQAGPQQAALSFGKDQNTEQSKYLWKRGREPLGRRERTSGALRQAPREHARRAYLVPHVHADRVGLTRPLQARPAGQGGRHRWPRAMGHATQNGAAPAWGGGLRHTAWGLLPPDVQGDRSRGTGRGTGHGSHLLDEPQAQGW